MKGEVNLKKELLLKKFKKLKKNFESELHSETLRKFKILSEAYKLGKQIYGRSNFSIFRLSYEFEVPYSTAKRILSLEKANKNTWKKIKEKKITSFKASMILLKKKNHYQDEMIDMVIKDNLSTYQIRSLNIENLQDIKKERLRIAVENGFARSTTAYISFYNTLSRMNELLSLGLGYLPKNKLPELKDKLLELPPKIKEYVKKIDNGKRKNKI